MSMKLKDGFITYETGDEQMMVASGHVKFHGMVRSNRTAAFIIDCLKRETTQEDIVERMWETFEAPRGVLEQDVARILEKLRAIGALDE